ncbi:endo-1,4-beta-xylanase [Capsulimonas corticalis]|uniref:Endo-1,4-beta-xylanase n=1 Tax=Capsulimonas corticalis TaxID=2219043 RepID=A0A402CRL0_9BACT|nr:alpha/beta hydrolase-fold protein [Capsulimonas corticalis]BDI28093.1 endo-1,4-beta-xylanase [Capsulimonas corticalis]
MKIAPILALLCAVAGVAPVFGADTKPLDPHVPEGKVIRIAQTATLVRNKKNLSSRDILVYEPPGYDDPENANRRYPVLYLLHGSPGNPSNFLNFGHWPEMMDREVQQGACVPAILVMPDGNYAGSKYGDSEWVNSADGRDRYEDYVAKETVAWADANLRTQSAAQSRILCGVSEGGYGAVNIGLHHPEVFGKVVALSGYYHNDGSGWARQVMGHDPQYLRANSPLDYLSGLDASSKSVSAWKKSLFYLGAGEDEGLYVTETRALASRFDELGIPQTLSVLSGHHGWGLWNALFVGALKTVLPPDSAPAGGSSAAG